MEIEDPEPFDLKVAVVAELPEADEVEDADTPRG
jgi:hypothetical protein